MHIRKNVALLLVIAMLSGTFSGCSGGNNTSAGTSDTTAQQATNTASQKQGKSSADFNWKKYSGTTLNVSLVQHFCSAPVIKKLSDFEAKTGIKVNHTVTPESNYFDKVSTSLSSRSGDPDVFMSGAYQLWDYSSAGYVEDLSTYLNDPNATPSDYDYNDFVPSTINAFEMGWDPGS